MKSLVLASVLLASNALVAQDLPQPSPKGRVEQIVGLTKVTVDYSRPSVKGRKIFGDLLPYGKVWRTGANSCTTIRISSPVKVEGADLGAGVYSLFTIPTEDTWVVIFNTDTTLWGEEDRKDSLDVLRVKVPHVKTTELTETLTFDFESVKDDKARLDLRWENTLVSINLFADATEQALANIDAAMAKPDADFRVYNSCARFCVDRNIAPAKALAWAQKSVGMEKKFWNTYTLALSLAQNGKYTEAIAMAEESMKLAQEAKYDAYVSMNKERIDEWRMKK
ncbi:MAG: DUF2911 domain-containing protein [Flavobacteriales bacterium]